MRQTIWAQLSVEAGNRVRFVDIQIPRHETWRFISLKCRPEGRGTALVTAQINRRSHWRAFFTNLNTSITIDQDIPGGSVLRILQEPWGSGVTALWISVYVDRKTGGA